MREAVLAKSLLAAVLPAAAAADARTGEGVDAWLRQQLFVRSFH